MFAILKQMKTSFGSTRLELLDKNLTEWEFNKNPSRASNQQLPFLGERQMPTQKLLSVILI